MKHLQMKRNKPLKKTRHSWDMLLGVLDDVWFSVALGTSFLLLMYQSLFMKIYYHAAMTTKNYIVKDIAPNQHSVLPNNNT